MTFSGLIRTERNQALSYSLVVGTAVFIYVTGGAIINPTNRDSAAQRRQTSTNPGWWG